MPETIRIILRKRVKMDQEHGVQSYLASVLQINPCLFHAHRNTGTAAQGSSELETLVLTCTVQRKHHSIEWCTLIIKMAPQPSKRYKFQRQGG